VIDAQRKSPVESKRRKTPASRCAEGRLCQPALSKRPDGTLTIEVAAPSPVEVSLDVSREIEDIVNEWDKIGDKHDKPSA
jgi:hypothetical protein